MVLSGSDQVLCNHQVIFNQAEQVVLHSAQLQIAHYALQQVPFDHSSSHVQKKKGHTVNISNLPMHASITNV